MRSRHPRLIALFALVALFFATTTYVAHGLQDGTVQHDTTQCDLCLQFSGSAGAPADVALPGRPPLVVVRTTPVIFPALPAERHDSDHRPRGPPALT
jgi:hypothetical protein